MAFISCGWSRGNDFLTRAEAFFHRCVQAGQDDGSISRAHSAQDLGRLLLGVLLGVRVLARAKPQRALLTDREI